MKINFYIRQWGHFYEKYVFESITEEQIRVLADAIRLAGENSIHDLLMRLNIPHTREWCKEAYITNRGTKVKAVLNNDHPYAIDYLG